MGQLQSNQGLECLLQQLVLLGRNDAENSDGCLFISLRELTDLEGGVFNHGCTPHLLQGACYGWFNLGQRIPAHYVGNLRLVANLNRSTRDWNRHS